MCYSVMLRIMVRSVSEGWLLMPVSVPRLRPVGHRLDDGLIGRRPLFGLLAGVDGGRLACVIL